MEHICPICNQETKFTGDESSDRSSLYSYEDYGCQANMDGHSYIYRIVDGTLTYLKVRLNDESGAPLFLRVLYDQDIAEVWSKSGFGKKINIGKAFVPDFSDLDRLKNKIKLYMLLS